MLDTDKHQELLARLEGNEEPSEETEAPEVQAEEAESVPHDEPEGEEEPLAEASGEEEEEDHPHNVPYNRFKDVIEQRNELREMQKQYEAEMEELRARMDHLSSAGRQHVQEPEPVETYDSYDDEEGIDWMKWQKNVESRFEEYESQMARESLERDLEVAQDKYPDVPQNAILQAVALDGSTDVMEFARDYSQFIQEVQEAGIARFREEQAKEAKADAKPRARSRSSSSSKGDNTAPAQPMTLEDTHAAVVRALKGQ